MKLEPARRYQSEAQFQAAIKVLAEAQGWKVFSLPDSRRITGTSKGFPDLLMLRNGSQVVAELKIHPATAIKGRPTKVQESWLHSFALTGAKVYAWRPEDWDSGAIERVLQ